MGGKRRSKKTGGVEGSKKTKVEAESQQAPPVPEPDCSDPMMNSVVLQTLFKFASIEEIKTYRQVCRIWNEVSLVRMRRDGWVRLVSSKSETNGLYFEDYLDEINGVATTSNPFQFGKHPYNNFKLNNFKRISLVDGDDGRQLEFWSKCGPKMKQLEISNSSFRSVKDFEGIFFRFVPSLKCLYLKETTISVSQPGKGKKRTEIDLKDAPPELTINSLEELNLIRAGRSDFLSPVKWRRFLGQYPKMKSLSVANNVRFNFRSPGHDLDNILTAMTTVAREQGISWNLEKLDLLFMGTAVFETHHLQPFQQLQLPITTLRLQVGYNTASNEFEELLKTCAPTLRKLVVYRDPDDLDALTELWLTGRGVRPRLDFLAFTPNLERCILAQDIGNSLLAAGSRVSGHETLERLRGKPGDNPVAPLIEKNVMENTDFSKLEHLVCPKLEELIISGRDETIFSPGHVAALCRVMPNLKTLMLGLGNDGFRVACEGWKQLEVLIVQPCELDQYGLTGNAPISTLKQRLPNLTDLKRLRYFGMGCLSTSNGWNKRSSTNLVNESVLNAILPLENLEGLTAVYDDDEDKMSREVRDQLRSKFPRSQIRENGNCAHEWTFSDPWGGQGRY
ncbi:hypothetical protein Ocin01_14430 [Orchesella cincta]|uniref:F-box domain-containing protein n=1 Tax=Orchesella cincta TaxID=48709 RepID=A0A1D2MH73_ORCCI|nr:hypothetical protein Ocin01_14430 [Orchesella cincta]